MENMTIREVIHDLNSIIYDNTETKEERDNATFLKMLYSGSQDSVRHDSTFSFNALNNLNEKYLSKSKNGEDPSNLFKEFRSELLLNENKETKKDYLSFHGNVITKYNEHIPLDEVFNFYKDENGNLVLYGFNYDNLYDISPKAIKEMSLPKTLSCIEEGAFEGIEPHVVDIALNGLDKTKEDLIKALRKVAKPFPTLNTPFSKDEYNKLFPFSTVQTPIGEIKLGENQFEKLIKNNRQDLLKVMKDVLAFPDIIIEEKRGKEEAIKLYASSYIFNSGKTHAVESVIIASDGKNISVSTHERDINNFVNKIKDSNQLLYVATRVGALIGRMYNTVTANPTRASEYVTPHTDSIQENENKSSDDNMPKGGPKP